MQADEIRAHMRKRPFVPFRVRLEDGTVHEVRHERGAIVTDRNLIVGVGAQPDRPTVFRDYALISLWQIVQLDAAQIPMETVPAHVNTGNANNSKSEAGRVQ